MEHQKHFNRREWIGFASGALAVGAGADAAAQDLAGKTGRIVVPFPPGGPADILARMVAEGMRQELNLNFVVDNKPGASGNIGAAEVVRSKADGLTLLLTNTQLVTNPHLYKNTVFVDPLKQLATVSSVGTTWLALAVRGDSKERKMDEWVTKVRKSGRATYGSVGVGSAAHLYASLLGQKLGLNLEHVPYRGDQLALADLVGGTIDFNFAAVGSLAGLVKEGKLHALAVSGTEPNALLPGVPTFSQLGISGYEGGGWLGIFAPAGTPSDVLAKLSSTTTTIVGKPEVGARMSSFGLKIFGSTPEAFSAMVRQEHGRVGEMVKAANVSLD